MASSFLSNQGTQTSLLVDTNGGTSGTLIPVMKLSVDAGGTFLNTWDGGVYVSKGTVAIGSMQGIQGTGVVGTVNPLITGGTSPTNGTIFAIQVDSLGRQKFDLITGTITNGSIVVTAGTFRQDARTTQNILTYGTQIAGTAALVATIVGSASVGAGTSLWINDLSLDNPNANVTVIVGFGTVQQGTNVLFRGSLGTSGAVGIQKSYPKAVNAGMTNQDLVVSLSAAGTVDINVSYFISA